MSTTPVETWAVDLADVTFIYPGVGAEVVMTIVGVVLWLGWHVWQVRFENDTYAQEIEKYGNKEKLHQAIDEG